MTYRLNLERPAIGHGRSGGLVAWWPVGVHVAGSATGSDTRAAPGRRPVSARCPAVSTPGIGPGIMAWTGACAPAAFDRTFHGGKCSMAEPVRLRGTPPGKRHAPPLKPVCGKSPGRPGRWPMSRRLLRENATSTGAEAGTCTFMPQPKIWRIPAVPIGSALAAASSGNITIGPAGPDGGGHCDPWTSRPEYLNRRFPTSAARDRPNRRPACR